MFVAHSVDESRHVCCPRDWNFGEFNHRCWCLIVNEELDSVNEQVYTGIVRLY